MAAPIKIYSDYSNAPNILKEFLYYSQTIKGLSPRTVEANYIDLQLFFRFLIQKRNNCINNDSINEVDISKIDLEFISKITQSEILEFLYFLSNIHLFNKVFNLYLISVMLGLTP